MPPPTQIGYVFVHCGTNNASTVRHNMTVTQSAKEMEHCIETLMKFYTHAKIVISGILPRNDKENLRGQDINELVSGYCVQQKQYRGNEKNDVDTENIHINIQKHANRK